MKAFALSVVAALLLFFSGTAFAAGQAGQGEQQPEQQSGPKVLIIYYSLTGNTDRVARYIQEQTGADLYRIETVNAYPTERPAMVEVPKQELESGQLPELQGSAPGLSEYDLIMVGSPVWWYTVSTPMMSFLKDTDFQGKAVAPFCTHGGGIGDFFTDFETQAKNARVIEGLPLWGYDSGKTEKLELPVRRWLAKLNRQL